MLQRLRNHLIQSRHCTKQMADRGRQDQSFQEGEWMLVKPKPYRQDTVAHRQNFILSKRFYGPFMIIAKVGPVAYTLQLPQESKTHPAFHVSQLRRFQGTPPTSVPQIPTTANGLHPVLQLAQSCVLDISCKKGNHLNKFWFSGLAANLRMLLGKILLRFVHSTQTFTLRTRWYLRRREVI